MQIFKLTNEIIEFLKGNGHILFANEQPKYIHCPL